MNRLAEWMRERGMSDEDLAAQVGTTRATISRLRRGKLVPTLRLAAAIKSATGEAVLVDDFIPNLSSGGAA